MKLTYKYRDKVKFEGQRDFLHGWSTHDVFWMNAPLVYKKTVVEIIPPNNVFIISDTPALEFPNSR
jgi:hypothetical protein